MANIETAALSFRSDLMNMTRELVWKNHYEASKYEQYINTSVAEQYIWAAQRLLEKYSTTQIKQFIEYDDQKFEALLQTADSTYVKPLRVIRNYEEENDYYRKLNGEPPLHPTGYATAEECCIPVSDVGFSQEIILDFGIENSLNTLYLHQLSPSQLSFAEALGYLDRIKEMHSGDSNFDYLKYMTTKKIYPFVSRMADKFDLLYLPKATLSALSDDFAAVYSRSRAFMIERYYTEAYRNKYEFYEGFVGLAILFMTIQQLNVMYLDTDITREFYDLDSIKIVYQAYSVPFYEDIPVNYHAKIVKLINRLLAYKGSNHIIFDLAALFDYDKLVIYQYYLMKTQNLNPDGTPHFEYTDVYDEDGNYLESELNYEGTYNINFVKRAIGQESPYEAVNNDANYLDYEGVILDDHYWLDDADLREKMYKSEYNFIETKYIGLQTQISMAKYFYETVYYMRMIMDNKDIFSQIMINNSKLGTSVSLFTTVIYLHALICKKLGWTQTFDTHAAPGCNYNGGTRCTTCYGNIPTEPTKIAKIFGYNFKSDLVTIMTDCLITDAKHSIHFLDENGDGLYLYPNPKTMGIDQNTIDIHIYQIRNNAIEKMLGTLYDYPTNYNNMTHGIGYGIRTNAKDIITRALKDVLGYMDSEIEEIFNTHTTKVKDASVEMFDNSYDRAEFIEMLNQLDMSNGATVNSTLGVASMYRSIVSVREYIENKLMTTTDKEVFYAYKHLYKILMTTDILPEIITKKTYKKTPIYATDEDGNIIYDQDANGNFVPKIIGYNTSDEHEMATSYEDLLEDLDFVLSVRLMNLTTDDQVREEIDYILIELQKTCDDLKYITSYGVYNLEVVVEYLYKLILFFKSVKVQLLDFNVIYLLDSRVDNMFKLMTDFKAQYKQAKLPDDVSFAVALFDYINNLYSLHVLDEGLVSKDVMLQFALVYELKSLILGKDSISYKYLKDTIDSFVDMFDEINKSEQLIVLNNKLKALQKALTLQDEIKYDKRHFLNEICTLLDTLVVRINDTLLDYAGVIRFSDDLIVIELNHFFDDDVIIKDNLAHASLMIGPGSPSDIRTIGYIAYDDITDDEYSVDLTPVGEDGPMFSDDNAVEYPEDADKGTFVIESSDDSYDVEVNNSSIGIWSTEDSYAMYFEEVLPSAPYEVITINAEAFSKLYKQFMLNDTMTIYDILRITGVIQTGSPLNLRDKLILLSESKRYDNYGFSIPDSEETDTTDAVLTTELSEIIASSITETWTNPDYTLPETESSDT